MCTYDHATGSRTPVKVNDPCMSSPREGHLGIVLSRHSPRHNDVQRLQVIPLPHSTFPNALSYPPLSSFPSLPSSFSSTLLLTRYPTHTNTHTHIFFHFPYFILSPRLAILNSFLLYHIILLCIIKFENDFIISPGS